MMKIAKDMAMNINGTKNRVQIFEAETHGQISQPKQKQKRDDSSK